MFIEKVKADNGPQEQLEAAADADSVVTIAKEAGFVISSEDLKQAQAELSDEELESVAGGFSPLITALVTAMFWKFKLC